MTQSLVPYVLLAFITSNISIIAGNRAIKYINPSVTKEFTYYVSNASAWIKIYGFSLLFLGYYLSKRDN